MKHQNYSLSKLAIIAMTLFMVIGLPVMLSGQEAPNPSRVPMVQDWSTHHTVFSSPGTFEQATRNGSFAQWYNLQGNPRYQMAVAARNADRRRGEGKATETFTPGDGETFPGAPGLARSRPHRPLPPPRPTPQMTKPQGDWNNFLGGKANAGIDAAMYPAKYTWNLNAAPDCTKDFMVVPVNQAPANAATATGTVVIHAQPAAGNTVTVGGVVYTFETTCAGFANCVLRPFSTATDATNLAAAFGGTCGAGSTSCASVTSLVTVGAVPASTIPLTAVASGTAGNIALATNSAANIYLNGVSQAASTLTGGVDGQATLIAFNNLYVGAAVAASVSGTVSSNSASGGQTVTVGGLTVTASAPVQATGLVTINANPTNAQDVYVDINTTGATPVTEVYAFHDIAANCGTAKCVQIGATTAATAANLAAAIGGSCLNLCTAPDANVTATSVGNVVTLTAITPGTGGNSMPLSVTNAAGGNVTVSGADLGTGAGTVAGSDGVNTGTNFAYWSVNAAVSASALATNIAAAIARNSATAGATATATGSTITVTANSTGTSGNGIAVAESLSGFSWGGSALEGGTPSGLCGTGSPNIMWAYNASSGTTGSAMLGSPILSYDGTQVAFIESVSNGTSSESVLHVLRWKSGEGGSSLAATPVAPSTSTSTSATYTTCISGATSCMFNLVLSTGSTTTNTYSPPYYDYATDKLWVGNDNGVLFQVTGVFTGTPTIGWTTTVTSGTALTGPIPDYFSGHGNILVANTAGVVHIVSNAGGLSGTSYTVTGAAAGVITDPIIEDAVTGMIYIFSGGNGTVPHVTQIASTLTGTPVVVSVGSGSAGNSQIHSGDFSNAYWTSPSTGLLYVCGEQTTAGNVGPALFAIGFTGNTLNSSIAAGPLALTTTATTAGQCSPLAEVYNPNQGASGTDWLFAGVPANCAFGGNAGGCIMAFDITSGFPAAAFATGAEAGGTSGIVADNVSTLGQTSSTYFTTLSSPGAGGCTNEPAADSTTCLVKRTQAGLQ